MTKPKDRKCANRDCRQTFQPWNALQKVCSLHCAKVIGKKEVEKKAERERKEVRKWVREGRERLKGRGELLKEAQQAFNAFVRARDAGQPCISCGSYPDDSGLITGSRVDAGHYRSVGACPELRFDEMNCHAQCVKCNQHLSGNAVEYRINLIGRVGQAEVDRLEGPHEAKHYSIDDLKEIKAYYLTKTRELKRRKAA